jgi:DNA-directed RNA polymerase subunit H
LLKINPKIFKALLNTMHILQAKHSKLDEKESEKLLSELNISKAQLPKIFINDPALPEECQVGDIIKIERKYGDKTEVFFRVVV